MWNKEILTLVRKLQKARLTLMIDQPFYAVLLLHLAFSLDEACETVYTDGKRIAFSPDFLAGLSDKELQFVLMHEVLHAALDHCGRSADEYDFDDYNSACDVVVNSNILYSSGMDPASITLRGYGECMHKTPHGDEGHLFTVEQVYRMLRKKRARDEKKQKEEKKRLSRYEDEDEDGGDRDGPEESARPDGGFDDHSFWGVNRFDGEPEEKEEGDGKDKEKDGDEKGEGKGKGDEKSEDEGDGKDKGDEKGNGKDKGEGEGEGDGKGESECDGESDDSGEKGGKSACHVTNKGHKSAYDSDAVKEDWQMRLLEAKQIVDQMVSIGQGGKGCGNIPLCAKRVLEELTEPQTDWRTILDDFVQEEVNDYSFNPPDRRFQDSPFLLPDFNEKDDSVKDVLFMIDTSGSMSDNMIRQAYSEVYGAIQQFDGKLTGWLGFFDAKVVEPKEFTDEESFKIIRPEGGGGTSFHCIFEYVKAHRQEIEPVSIIILTDGGAPFPDEKDAEEIPVLWLINNEYLTPPWGKVARIKGEY